MKNRSFKKVLLAGILAILLILTTACGNNPVGSTSDTQDSKENTEITAADACAKILLEAFEEPMIGATGGDWVAFGLARWGGEVPQEWSDSYYTQLESYVSECGGVLHNKKYTEYSRVIITLTALGKDPTNVAGYNLLEPLADFEQTVFQGVNGPAFALLALDSKNYEIPANTAGTTQATREMYVDYILSKESEGGGWSLSGGAAEVDLTAMVLQALAKYQGREDVADATQRALDFISAQQNENGGFVSYDVESSETVAQVIVALCELGIRMDDNRFVKNGKTLEDRLMDFLTEDSCFAHIPGGDRDVIATEQGFYALVALEREAAGKAPLYNMTDVQ